MKGLVVYDRLAFGDALTCQKWNQIIKRKIIGMSSRSQRIMNEIQVPMKSLVWRDLDRDLKFIMDSYYRWTPFTDSWLTDQQTRSNGKVNPMKSITASPFFLFWFSFSLRCCRFHEILCLFVSWFPYSRLLDILFHISGGWIERSHLYIG